MFSHRVRIGLAMAVLVVLPVVARAQMQDKKASLDIGGGVTFPLGNTAKAVSTGGHLLAAINFYASQSVAIQFQYLYNRHDVKGNLFDVTAFDANHVMESIDMNFVIAPHGHRNNGPYLVVGGGAYYRKVDVTKFDGYAGGAVCNPWLLICYPVGVPVENVVGVRSRWDAGANVGLGVQFHVGRTTRMFLESKYNYIFGPSFDTPTGRQKATGEYVPISLGFRF
jgi:Outer membrane protein beta-barrel domain